jgi:hypothetical protein
MLTTFNLPTELYRVPYNFDRMLIHVAQAFLDIFITFNTKQVFQNLVLINL